MKVHYIRVASTNGDMLRDSVSKVVNLIHLLHRKKGNRYSYIGTIKTGKGNKLI